MSFCQITFLYIKLEKIFFATLKRKLINLKIYYKKSLQLIEKNFYLREHIKKGFHAC
jgi:hypothetical protein